VSLFALNPVRVSRRIVDLDLGGGADVAQAASEEGFTDTKPDPGGQSEHSHRRDPQRRGHGEKCSARWT
jgi:hypothetical protein